MRFAVKCILAIGFCATGFLFVGCETMETKTSESHEREETVPWPSTAIIIDVRKRFEYDLGHWPNAYNLPAHEVTVTDRDLKRRLSLFGVTPKATVILVGNQKPKELAEKLKAIDVDNVKTYGINEIKQPLVREEPSKPEAKPIW